MTRSLRGVAPLALATLVLSACGGSPAGPTPGPTPVVVTAAVLDGISGASLDSRTGTPGSPVTISRAGYLRRDTMLPVLGPITLWPITVSEDYVRALVYQEVGQLLRWATSTMTIAGDYPGRAIQDVNSLGFVTLVPTATDPAITWAIDPSDPTFSRSPNASAVTYRVLGPGATIGAARVVFRSVAATRYDPLPIHELGHVLGLHHSPRPDDLMAPLVLAASFSPDERILLAMMYAHRRAGQVAPDNDQSLGAARLTERVTVVVD